MRRLREKAYALPEREHTYDIVSNPHSCQDVVQIDIEPNPFTGKEPEPLQEFDWLMSGLDIDQPKAIKVDYSAAS